jgi:hypothetical protein
MYGSTILDMGRPRVTPRCLLVRAAPRLSSSSRERSPDRLPPLCDITSSSSSALTHRLWLRRRHNRLAAPSHRHHPLRPLTYNPSAMNPSKVSNPNLDSEHRCCRPALIHLPARWRCAPIAASPHPQTSTTVVTLSALDSPLRPSDSGHHCRSGTNTNARKSKSKWAEPRPVTH